MSTSLKLFHKCFLHEKEMINEIIKYVGSTLLPLFYRTNMTDYTAYTLFGLTLKLRREL